MGKTLSIKDTEALLLTLQKRFADNMSRHIGIDWNDVSVRLNVSPEKLWSLSEMEITGGEPDVIGFDENTGEYVFCDCSKESPKGRRSICYDKDALDSRKEFKPSDSAIEMAQRMGIEILTEERYGELQKKESFDTKTSSWLKTPAAIRSLGGAIFGEFRYGHMFVFHNGAQSYYGVRGFRGILKI